MSCLPVCASQAPYDNLCSSSIPQSWKMPSRIISSFPHMPERVIVLTQLGACILCACTVCCQAVASSGHSYWRKGTEQAPLLEEGNRAGTAALGSHRDLGAGDEGSGAKSLVSTCVGGALDAGCGTCLGCVANSHMYATAPEQ
jgi:hypothetical protein